MSPELSFFDKLDNLKNVLRNHGGAASAFGSLSPYLLDPDIRSVFFRLLESPDWIKPLREAGYFNNPPEARHLEDGRLQYPLWAESKYLIRMALLAPIEVASIFSEIDTDNVWIIGDMIKAGLAMPTDAATKLVSKISTAARCGSLWIHFKDASELCVRLAEGGEAKSAMELAEALFTPKLGDGKEKLSEEDKYWYKEGLKNVLPALIKLEPREFLLKLCYWLKVIIYSKKNVDQDSGSDNSHMWRPAIEEHGQNRDYEFASVMVGFVRQSFEQAIRNGGISLDEALEIIISDPYEIFKRIRVHLINVFAEKNPVLARQVMMDRVMFDDYRFKHEYAMLVGHRLDLLTPEERDIWFGWVDVGPDISNYRDANEDDLHDRIQHWQLNKLHCVRSHLKGEQLKFYEDMLAKYGKPDLSDLNFRISSAMRWGHESPMTFEELNKLTFEQAIEQVSLWRPEEQSSFMGPSKEGLASIFGKYVASDPKTFSTKAEELVEHPAIYVRTFIQQMAEAVKAGANIDVSAVIKLCNWVIEKPLEERTTTEQRDEGLVDTDWQSTRNSISDLIQNVCKAVVDDTPKYPLDVLRNQIWRLIDVLYRGQAESYIVHDKEGDDPRAYDYLMMGMNSPRGRALEAAFEYTRWVANYIKRIESGHEIIPGGFEAMPEVREMLEWQIKPENRSFEALAVIGANIGIFYWIDKRWLAENAGKLFYLEGIEQSPQISQGWAAWNAFLIWVIPHIELFKEQFEYAVGQAVEVDINKDSQEHPMNHLGEHLMTIYGRGQIQLDDDHGLLRRFLAESKPDIRTHAITFVGNNVEGEEKIPEQVAHRFKELWKVYWEGPGKMDAKEKPDAYLFGTWFSSGQFPEQWALNQFEEFVNVNPKPEPSRDIMEQLAKICHTDILKAVRILDKLVHGDQDGWRMYVWKDYVKQILEIAMQVGGDVRIQAEQVINYLGRRGYTQFGELLEL